MAIAIALQRLRRAAAGRARATRPRCRARRRCASSSTRSPARKPHPLTKCNSNATTLVELRRRAELHGHHRVAEHSRRQAADNGGAARQGRARRLLDLLLHQLPADAAARRGLVPGVRQGRASSWSACTPPSSRSSTWCRTCGRRPRRSACTTRSRSTTNYDTWNAYNNEYWPADYLIDAQGNVRHVHFGEGDYAGTEQLIRQLLTAAHPGLALPPATAFPTRRPTGEMSPETYIGYEQLQYLLPGGATSSATRPPRTTSRRRCRWRLWACPGPGPTTRRRPPPARAPSWSSVSSPRTVYLVLGGHGTLGVTINGRHDADDQRHRACPGSTRSSRAAPRAAASCC